MRVKMVPNPTDMGGEESGVRRVVDAYARYGKDHGIEFVDKDSTDYDLFAVHAGMSWPEKLVPIVAITHGLYWTADYLAYSWEYKTNAKVIESIRAAKVVTVPSAWVAETLQRDMHVRPVVVPHGIEWEDWQHNEPNEGYVLWNKNRAADVCDPAPVSTLAMMFPLTRFLTTFTAEEAPPRNVRSVGIVPHQKMKKMIQRAAVYLGTTKETFGIGVLEALASGTPVLGFNHGGNKDLIQHGVNGYLARPGDYDDLKMGLEYCVNNRDILSVNAIESAKKWTWDKAMDELCFAFDLALKPDPVTIGVVIPTYNYADKVSRAIQSVLDQNIPVDKIVVVDDGSTDDTTRVVKDAFGNNPKVRYIKQDNAGVANARNNGIEHCDTKYIICLDADDAIDHDFVRACLPDLEKDPALGIAYTGITAVTADGETSISPWPTQFDYDAQLKRHNQVPTCCMFRREIWEKLGGYRQRYAPQGAGAEDAEFWLRAGSIGYGAKKVTDAGLFIYSLGTGRVSGNREYREVDWTAWHPWTTDGRHPFASVARPKRFSHPVRQYDEPIVSVIIPVGPSHKKSVIDALDSLEAQTFRKWEAIVVDDTGNDLDWAWQNSLEKSFPFIRLTMSGGKGAGIARNMGASLARAPFLLFLDADDWLYPEAIQRMLERWESSNAIVYSDYVSKADLTLEYARSIQDKLLYYDEKTGNAVINSRSSHYDCNRAVSQPDPKDMYIWNLITSLVPKVWHDEIGGFDENMSSWEDWDYWIRMARAGKCFDHVETPLVVYRFYTGTRREIGQQDYKNLIEYLSNKYKKETPMPCSCGGNRANNEAVLAELAARTARSTAASISKGNGNMLDDEDYVLCLYDHPNRGQHMVRGAATGINYNYRGGGEKFLVHRKDIAAQPNIFKPIAVEATAPVKPPEAPPPPKPVVAVATREVVQPQVLEDAVDVLDVETEDAVEFSLDTIPGVTPEIASKLQAMGVQSLQDLINVGSTGLTQIKGIGPARADAILAYAKKTIAEQEEK